MKYQSLMIINLKNKNKLKTKTQKVLKKYNNNQKLLIN